MLYMLLKSSTIYVMYYVSLCVLNLTSNVFTPVAGSVFFPSFSSTTSLHVQHFSLHLSSLCVLCSSPIPQFQCVGSE